MEKETRRALDAAAAAGDALDAREEQRYRAPALEKGLDVLELLARSPGGLTLSAIVHHLDRSHGELFRMIQVLQHRGYIDQTTRSGEFQLTDKLFLLGMEQPRSRSLVETALPTMRTLALQLGQSCHLAFHSNGEIVVAARMESGEHIGFTVRVGYRRPLLESSSGMLLLSFQPDDMQTFWRSLIVPRPSAERWRETTREAAEIRERGYLCRASTVVGAVQDISAPIMRGDRAAAALTIPFLVTRDKAFDELGVAKQLLDAVSAISKQLVQNDNRA